MKSILKLFNFLTVITLLTVLGLQNVPPVKAVAPDQTITIQTSAPATAADGESFTVAATSDSGLDVSYSATGVCSNVGATFTMTSASGTCAVQYDQAGDGTYNPAPQLTENVTAQSAATAKESATGTGAALFAAAWGDDQSGANPCTDRTVPCLNIQQAVAKANPGDMIFVTAERFYGSGMILAPIINIVKNITISGGWNADFTIQNSLTTLDGQHLRPDVIVKKDIMATLQNFNITNSDHSGITNSGTLILLSSMLYNNNINSNYDGGGISNSGILTVENTAIYNNDSLYSGGGILNSGSLTIKNATIANNHAHDGGAIMYTPKGHVTGIPLLMILNNVTISNNTADWGNGIYRAADTATAILQDPILYNSIIAYNSCMGNITSANNNLIYQSDGCATTGSYRKSDPLLGSFSTKKGYFPLQHGSPAIDTGSAAIPGSSVAACQATDQLGTIRPQDGNGDTVARCDIGAYEADPNEKLISIDGRSSQSTQVSNAFANQLRVLVKDQFDAPLAGIAVRFTAPASGASGTFADSGRNTTTAITNSNGIATTTVLTANTVIGNYLVSAAIPGTSISLQFNLRNTPGKNKIMYVSPTGNNTNTCLTRSATCQTINAALNKAQAGDSIEVAVGNYTYEAANSSFQAVVTIKKSITLSGGWNTTFTLQTGLSTIMGQNIHTGIWVEPTSMTAIIERFVVKNSLRGIYNLSNNLTLNRSAIRDNNPGKGYGAGIYNLGTMTINNTTISGNTLSGSGAGIASGFNLWSRRVPGTLTINNSTISGNTANDGNGGGIWLSGSLTLNNTTISGNSATKAAGVISLLGDIFVYNSIIAGNIASQAPDCFSVSMFSRGYTLLGNSADCHLHSSTGDLLDVDPKLGVFTGGNYGYYPLLAGSPAIDAGNPALPGSSEFTCLTRDQRNVLRPQGSFCDIGAYEYQAP